MIKLDDSEEVGSVDFDNADEVTLTNLKMAILDLAQRNNVPVSFYIEDAKAGGFLGETHSALVAYHPEHRYDYYNIAMILQKRGSRGSISVFTTGTSKQTNKFARSEFNKEWRKGRSMSQKLGNAAASAVLNAGKSKQKLADEQAYYDILLEIIGVVLND